MKRIEIKKLALSAILCGLSVVILAVGCMFDMVDLISCSVAAIIVAFSKIELRGKYPYLIYATSAVLSFILFPGSTASLYYAVFMGYYPILKSFLEIRPGKRCLISKVLFFNLAFALLAFFARSLFLSPDTEISAALIGAIIILSNIFFAVFDFALTVFCNAYICHFRKKWGIDKIFGTFEV